VIAAEFDPDGRSLATACQDGNVRLRCTAAQDVLAIVERKITREFSHAEIEQYAELLGHDYDALTAAYRYLEPRLFAAVVVEDVAAEVRSDASLGEDVRAAALRVLERRYDDGEQVRERTWEIVRHAGRSPADYVKALRWATIADDLQHGSLGVRLLLGVAQHRVGDEKAALQTLEGVELEFGESSTGSHLACVAALALVDHSAGHDDEADDQLVRLECLEQARAEPAPFAYREFLDEARALQHELDGRK
jgi:hypothetical protein